MMKRARHLAAQYGQRGWFSGRLLCLLLPAALLFASCDGGGEGSGGGAPQGGSARVAVTAKETSFSTGTIEVQAGVTTAITLDNGDTVPHTLTIYANQAPEGDIVAGTGEVAPGEQGEAVAFFSSPGKRAFRCEVHPDQMQGVIDVR